MYISIKISPKFVPHDPINNIPALVQIMVWRCPGRPANQQLRIVIIYMTNHCWYVIAQEKQISNAIPTRYMLKYIFSQYLLVFLKQ